LVLLGEPGSTSSKSNWAQPSRERRLKPFQMPSVAAEVVVRGPNNLGDASVHVINIVGGVVLQ
jgi:hypothetical protein